MSDGLHLYVVYENPDDYPGLFVVRKWTVSGGELYGCLSCTTHQDLEAARDAVPAGYVNLGRRPDDDRAIREVWV